MFQPTYSSRTGPLMVPAALLQQTERWLTAISGSGSNRARHDTQFEYETSPGAGPTPSDCLKRLRHVALWQVGSTARAVRASTLSNVRGRSRRRIRREAFYSATDLARGDPHGVRRRQSNGAHDRTTATDSVSRGCVGAAASEKWQCGRPMMGPGDRRPRIGVQCADGEIGEIWVSRRERSPSATANDPRKRGDVHARLSGARGVSPVQRRAARAPVPAHRRTGYCATAELYVSGPFRGPMITDGRKPLTERLEMTTRRRRTR